MAYVPAWQGISPALLASPERDEPAPFPLGRPGSRYFYLARGAVYHAARSLGLGSGATALAPAYHNGLEIAALRAAGLDVRFFRVSARLEPDLDDIRRGLTAGARLVLVIHYLGWPQPIEAIRALCREHGAALLEDCALAFLSERDGVPLGSFGDLSVFCLYKTIPLPNGAVLAQNGPRRADIDALPLRSPGRLSTAARASELAIAWLRGRAERVGGALAAAKSWAGSTLSAASVRRVPVGDMTFDPAVLDLGMSPWAEGLLRRLDYGRIRERRRENYRHLLKSLEDAATPLLRTLPDGVCPLMFPLLVPDKAAAARELKRRGIETMEFWNAGDPAADGPEHGDTAFLRRHVLELPIHQDVTPGQVDHVARSVRALGLRMAAP